MTVRTFAVLALSAGFANPAAAGQLRTFSALRQLTLTAGPAAERAAADLSKFLTAEQMLVAADTDVAADARSTFARCVLYVDRPKPNPVALECSDHEHVYVGTLQAKNIGQLRDYLHGYRYSAGTAGGPLSAYHYILVEREEGNFNEHDHLQYVRSLLRADPTFVVVDSAGAVPAGEEARLLRCGVAPGFAYTGYYPFATIFSRLSLRTADGQRIRNIGGSGARYLKVEDGERKSLKDAVQRLLQEARHDAEIYAPRK